MINNEKSHIDSGILLVDKPLDWTSFDVANMIKRRFKIKKVGHCGTLDPKATGLLVLVLGKATKLASTFSSENKVYDATVRLGIKTDTQDTEGKVIAEHDTSNISEEMIKSITLEFLGESYQIPPMFSAVKKNGKALYKLARKGEVIEREPRRIMIRSIEIKNIDLPYFSFVADCSKGTYIRTLAEDIGEKAGCGAHLYALRRLSCGEFSVNNAFSVDTIKTWEKDTLLEKMIHRIN